MKPGTNPKATSARINAPIYVWKAWNGKVLAATRTKKNFFGRKFRWMKLAITKNFFGRKFRWMKFSPDLRLDGQHPLLQALARFLQRRKKYWVKKNLGSINIGSKKILG
jgi:hypothetical protein